MLLRCTIVAGSASGSYRAAAAMGSQALRTEPWSKILSTEAKQASKRHCSQSISGVSAEQPSEAGPPDPGSEGLEKQAADPSPRIQGASAHYMSPDGKFRKAAGLKPRPARKTGTRTKQIATKSTSSKRPATTKAIGIVRPETDQGAFHQHPPAHDLSYDLSGKPDQAGS